MTRTSLFPVGTRIIAISNVGPVGEGQPGIITSIVNKPFFLWSRPMYLCIFAGNVSLAVLEAVNAIAYATRYHSDWFWNARST
jgi:hypothetical protein